MTEASNRSTIIFVSALQEELDPLCYSSEFAWTEPLEKDTVWYRQCAYNNYNLIAACAGEMGLTTTTILVTKLVLRWQPILVVMSGICGGRKDSNLDVGDVIFSTAALHYQKGKILEGQLTIKPTISPTDGQIEKLVCEFVSGIDGKTISERFENPVPRIPRITAGNYASADIVVKDQSKFDEAAQTTDNVIALDMESFALMRVVRSLGVQFGGLAIKAVSDHADKYKTKTDRTFAKFMSKQTAIEFILNVFMPWHENLPSSKKLDSSVVTLQEGGMRQKPSILLLCGEQTALRYLTIGELDWQVTDSVPNLYGGSLLFTRVNGVSVFASALRREEIGLVGGAMKATILMQSLHPTLAIIIGSCGGLGTRAMPGDLIVANRAFHYQYGAYKEAEIHRELRCIDMNDRLRGFLSAISANSFEPALKKAHSSFQGQSGIDKPQLMPSWHMQPIGSSDLFVKDVAKISEAIQTDRKPALSIWKVTRL